MIAAACVWPVSDRTVEPAALFLREDSDVTLISSIASTLRRTRCVLCGNASADEQKYEDERRLLPALVLPWNSCLP